MLFENRIICYSNKDRFRPKSRFSHDAKRYVKSSEERGKEVVEITSVRYYWPRESRLCASWRRKQTEATLLAVEIRKR